MDNTTPTDMVFGILVDGSGSMGNLLPAVRTGLGSAKQGAIMHGVPMGIWAFSDWETPAAHLLVAFDEDDPARIDQALNIDPAGGTLLGPALVEVASILQKQAARLRILVVLLDGLPFDYPLVRALIDAIEEDRGVAVFGIHLGESTPADITEAGKLFSPLNIGAGRFAVAETAEDIAEHLRFLINLHMSE